MIDRPVLRVLVFSLSLLVGCSDDPSAPPDGGDAPALSFSTFQPAARVVGQTNMTSGASNGGGSTNASGLSNPVGAPAFASPFGPFYVVDQGNNRVLGFNRVPTANGVSADFVMGQPDFSSSDSGLGATRFTIPNRCFVSGQRFLLCDYGNARVLIWNTLPRDNVTPDVVVGQPDFDTRAFGVTASSVGSALGAMVAGGKLFVLDYSRLLIWNSVPTTHNAPADVVVGQTDFTTATTGLSATKFGDASAFWTDGARLVICDGGYDRVMIWSTVPTSNGAAADIVLGAPDFTTAGSSVPSQSSIGKPSGVASDGKMLAVSDAAFHRVLIYTDFPTVSGTLPSVVLGQSTFANAAPNDADQNGVEDASPAATTVSQPADARIIGARLFVADQSNARILAFESE